VTDGVAGSGGTGDAVRQHRQVLGAGRRGLDDPLQQIGRGVPQQHLRRRARPQRQLVTDPDHMAQRQRALFLRDADPGGVVHDVDVDRLALPRHQLAHECPSLLGRLPAVLGEVGPPPQAGPGQVAVRGGREQAAGLQGLDDPEHGGLGQAGGLDDLPDGHGRPLLGQQRHDLDGALNAADATGVVVVRLMCGHGGHPSEFTAL
jgi:hypothetical protein